MYQPSEGITAEALEMYRGGTEVNAICNALIQKEHDFSYISLLGVLNRAGINPFGAAQTAEQEDAERARQKKLRKELRVRVPQMWRILGKDWRRDPRCPGFAIDRHMQYLRYVSCDGRAKVERLTPILFHRSDLDSAEVFVRVYINGKWMDRSLFDVMYEVGFWRWNHGAFRGARQWRQRRAER